MQQVKEGSAVITGQEAVFYNHIQEFNRDISVVAIRAWSQTRTAPKKQQKKPASALKTVLEVSKEVFVAEPDRVLLAKQLETRAETEALEPISTTTSEVPLSSEFNLPSEAAKEAKQAERKAKKLEMLLKGIDACSTPFEPPATIAPFSILEALAATGLRSMRYALEIPGVSGILTNDLDPKAGAAIAANAALNGVAHLVTPSVGDASKGIYLSLQSSFTI